MAPALMPVLFVGHGSPMNAIEDNEFSSGWRQAAQRLPKPREILCVSAHWETQGTAAASAERPETIHDFYGFPQALFDVDYPAPGSPGLAREAAALLGHTVRVGLDDRRGLDHGAWSVLKVMYPKADIPVVQLSLDTAKPASFHFEAGRQLAPLRKKGVLILGSGNMVHNLRLMDYRNPKGYDWAERVNATLKARISSGDFSVLVDYPALDPEMSRAVPTPEHYLPLLYALALKRPEEPVSFFNDKTTMGSMSMTCMRVG